MILTLKNSRGLAHADWQQLTQTIALQSITHTRVLRGGKSFGVDTSLEALVDFDAQEEGFQVRLRELTKWEMDELWIS